MLPVHCARRGADLIPCDALGRARSHAMAPAMAMTASGGSVTASSPPDMPFSAADLEQLRERGVSVAEAVRQARLLAAPPRYVHLDRPATPGDGIRRLNAVELKTCVELAAAARAAGRCSRFIPASGAASRMFKELLAWREHSPAALCSEVETRAAAGDMEAAAVAAFLAGLDRFAFAPALSAALTTGAVAPDRLLAPVLDALLGDAGLQYATLPKGLLAFHRGADARIRTAFAEQLEEAASTVVDDEGTVRAHFTVSPEHTAAFTAALAAVRPEFATRGVRIDAQFTTQHPATDTLALDRDKRPFRDAADRLLFRPAGHGALIENLAGVAGDLVLIKNIDNIVPDHLRAPTIEWTAVLLGLAAALRQRSSELIATIRSAAPGAIEAAVSFLYHEFGVVTPPGTEVARAAFAEGALRRPLRVCGMVENTGETGGGPFWVRDAVGSTSLQIVESAQVDPRDSAQQAILTRATHFNPVFLVCALRDETGEPFDLHAFIDPDAVIVTEKSAGGRALIALERPGLWNGAMARWNTVFLEVPLAVFNPVKSVLDLLRPEHQAG